MYIHYKKKKKKKRIEGRKESREGGASSSAFFFALSYVVARLQTRAWGESGEGKPWGSSDSGGDDWLEAIERKVEKIEKEIQALERQGRTMGKRERERAS